MIVHSRDQAISAKPALVDRIEAARQACVDALRAEPLSSVDRFLTSAGMTPESILTITFEAAARRSITPALLALRNRCNSELGLDAGICAPERVLLMRTVLHWLPRITERPVDESVMHLSCRDFIWYADPKRFDALLCTCERNTFYDRLRVATLQRFPSGQLEWEVSGFPRGWLIGLTRSFSRAPKP